MRKLQDLPAVNNPFLIYFTTIIDEYIFLMYDDGFNEIINITLIAHLVPVRGYRQQCWSKTYSKIIWIHHILIAVLWQTGKKKKKKNVYNLCCLPWIYALKSAPVGVVSDESSGSSGSFGSCNIVLPSPERDDQTLSHLPYRMLKQIYGFGRLEINNPSDGRAFDWLLKPANCTLGLVYLKGEYATFQIFKKIL